MRAKIPTHHKDGRTLLHVETLEEWRAWLEKNHADSSGVWLVSWKKSTGKPFVPYSDSVDEALCFGWIDSRPNKMDEARAMRLFTPRDPKSPWSRINKRKVERLLREGRMSSNGVSMVNAANSNGAWTIYDEIEDLTIPPDLESALDGSAAAFFDAFPNSAKKNILWWIKTARKPETRVARIDKTVCLAAQNRMANHPAGRDKGQSPRPHSTS